MQILNDLLQFFISDAYADTTAAAASAPPQGGPMPLMLMTGIFILFMYFVMWRPQSKRAREHRNLVNSLVKGDEVITAGGMLGKISKISDNYVVISLADNVEITLQKSSIANALPKGTLKSITWS